MKISRRGFAIRLTIALIALVVVVVFILGFGIHTCYKDPRSNDDMNIGPYCKKDISTVRGHFNLKTGVFEMNRIIYIGIYRNHFVSLWSGSSISASPLLVLSNNWVVMATSCEIWDREQYGLNQYKGQLTTIPPSYEFSHNSKGEKIYDIRCYSSYEGRSKGVMFDSFSASELNDNNYELPSNGVLKIDARRR